MRCDQAREAISGELDGQLSSGDAERVAAHVGGCAACAQWREQAVLVTRRTRVGGPLPSPDRVGVVLAAVRDDQRWRRVRRWWLAVAAAVGGAGLIQLVSTVPLLLMARGHASGGGLVHPLGLIELGIGAGFFAGAVVVLWRERNRTRLSVVRAIRIDDVDRGAGTDVHEVA